MTSFKYLQHTQLKTIQPTTTAEKDQSKLKTLRIYLESQVLNKNVHEKQKSFYEHPLKDLVSTLVKPKKPRTKPSLISLTFKVLQLKLTNFFKSCK